MRCAATNWFNKECRKVNRRSHVRNALALVLGLVFLPWASAQQPASQDALPAGESVLDRYVEATGGAAAYKSRTSETVTGTLELAAAGLTGQLRVHVKPGLMRTSIELPGVGLIERGVKDGVAWSSDPFAGPQIDQGFEGEFMVANALPGATARWREVYKTVETTGIEDVNGEPAYRVVHTLGKGGALTGFYGVASGLLLKFEFTAQGAALAQLMEEYQQLGGTLTPTRVVTTMMGQRVSVIRFTSAETNVEIPDERFDLPEAVKALVK
jgi:hypothetical protein